MSRHYKQQTGRNSITEVKTYVRMKLLQRKGHSVVSTEQGGEGFLRIHSACHATLHSEHRPAREATLLMELVKRQEGARLFLQCTFKCDVPEQTHSLVDMLDLDEVMTFISSSALSRPFV